MYNSFKMNNIGHNKKTSLDDLLARHIYTVSEVAELMGVSRQTATRLFEKEKGVIIIDRPETTHKRRLRTIRIPREVYERVLHRLSVR
jgi:DNA-binding XRE family transcriptional regulator